MCPRAPTDRLWRRSRGSEGKKGRGGDAEAHPEDARKAGRDGGSRRTANRAAASSASAGKKRSSAAFPGSSARLVRRRGRGRQGGPSGCAGGARGALPRRREATARRLVSGVHAGRRNIGRERRAARGGLLIVSRQARSETCTHIWHDSAGSALEIEDFV
jgi:hypothetical protein